MKRTLIKLIFLTVLPLFVNYTVAEQQISLFEQFNRIRSDEEAVFAFIRSLSKQQVFDLCNQYGAAVDSGVEGNEGMLIEVALKEVKQKEGLLSSDLLACAGVDTASVHWRQLALRYATKDTFVDKQHIDSEYVLRFCSGLITNPSVASDLRGEACLASAGVLVDGYHTAASGMLGHDKSRLVQEGKADAEMYRAQDKKVAIFIDLVLELAQDEATPEDMRKYSIPRALCDIIRERGPNTPRIDRVQKFAEQESKKNGDLKRSSLKHPSRENEKLLREVRANTTNIIETGSTIKN